MCEDTLRYQKIDYTYYSGQNKSWIDHVVTMKGSTLVKYVEILDDSDNYSDHNAIVAQTSYIKCIDTNNIKKTFIWNEATEVIYKRELRKRLIRINTKHLEESNL